FTRNFNKVCSEGVHESVIYREDEIIDEINTQQHKINELLILYRNLLFASQSRNFRLSLDLCNEIIEQKGVSCFFVRVLFFIRNHTENVDEFGSVADDVDGILNKIEIENTGYLESAIRELSNPRTDYFNICKKIIDSEENNNINYIARSFISHVFRSKEVFLNTLNAYFSFSIIDSFLYYASSSRLKLPFTENVYNIDKRLIESFYSLSCVQIDVTLYLSTKDENMDLNFFRENFLLIELQDSFKYKTIHASIYSKNEAKEEERTPIEKKLMNDYFKSIRTLDDLRHCKKESYSINLHEYDSRDCSFLENSNALLFFIEKNDAELNGQSEQEDKFVQLMSHTRDIGFICPEHYLNKLENNAKTFELRLVIACLLSIKSNSSIVDHSLRKTIQEITVSKYNANLKDLIEYVYSVSPSVTEHLVQVCDETFLSKLFQITNMPNKAIKDRSGILDWYGHKIDDSSYIERAKNLTIDIQISKAKGTIDDSRIYVDPVKFTQWINDNVLNDLTLLLESTCGNEEIFSVNINWNKVKTGISTNEQISSLLLRCYAEFCNNKLFGIASYLGRRIRHGTFKGTGLKEAREFPSDKKYENIFNNHEFSERYSLWLRSYKNMFEKLKVDHLYINSKKKPEGLIYCELNSNFKKISANHMFMEIYNSYTRNGNSLEIPYLITEFCWRFIEEDLANIRKFIMENKSKHAVYNFDCNSIKSLKNREVKNFCQELNSATSDKFRTISGWFNKPSIASPSVELNLLFQAVISEIKGFFGDFVPKIVIGSSDFVISGGVYFAIYDALYVLIYNAAYYGKKVGELEFEIEYRKEGQLIKLSIISEVDSHILLEEAKIRINEALSADFENAHIIEGRSGIRKLKRMEMDEYISDVNFQFENEKINASFNFSVDY
ncbi:hypothetical protein H4J64_05770, partial [Colwellia sp. BRX8-2]|uniref:hypothetical protein n=1 Tax=Colwellia sp. BRX8-2 TaxID=2759838 RepID=UPI0015F68C91